ncbi:MAG: 5-methyltetrahydropteroyltriglutamate--homocysteine S-methyltransferase [Alphaproteobacteria bacterium]|nr:5-methyltetrahydropteroyltriglutamate--homocysteine S-methyltransferase [Alphaproteobacteria bacterium]
MADRTQPPFRADHVGSLLRPQVLLDARADWKAGKITREALRAIEDRHIRDVVKFQEDIGLHSITDGEFRRENFHFDFLDKIKGVDFRRIMPEGSEGKSVDPEKAPFVAFIRDRMKLPDEGIEVANYRVVRAATTRTPKITIPSPTMTHFRGGREAISREAYPTMEGFFADLADVYRAELARLAAAGCRYVQLDDTNLAYLCDIKMREGVKKIGEDPDELPATYAALINDAIRDRPADMKVCIHMCRGNAQSQWFASGGYEPIAEKVFNLTKVDGFFLEYDDERSGDFTPLRFVPKDKNIVLGLVTTKRGALESRDALKRRIDEAARHVPLDQLCLSPQCGFSSNAIGNLISVEDEAAKLRLVVETAREVWG